MKQAKLIALFCCVLVLFAIPRAEAKRHHFQRTMDRFSDRADVTHISFPPSLFSFMLGKDDADLKRFLRKIRTMNIYTCDGNVAQTSDLKSDISRSLNADAYEDLMVIRDGSDNLEIKVQKDGDDVSEVVVFITDAESLMVLQLEGSIEMKSIARFVRQVRKNNKSMS